MPNKLVELHRHYGFVHGANPDPESKEYFDMAYKAVGSYYKVLGKVFASGMTRKEEDIIMPEILGIYPEDRKEYRTAINQYFRNINTKIPPEGLKLNIGLQQEGELSEKNIPLNLIDYLIYKHAVSHPKVSISKEQADRMGALVQFYITDKALETESKSTINRLEDDASQYYFQYRDDEFKVEQILVLMGIKVKTYETSERVIKLKELSTLDNSKADAVNSKRLKKFIAVAKDKNMATKYDIMEMIRVDIFERVKFKVLDKDTGEIIGDNLQESVLWMQDKRNSKDVNVYYAKLKELGKSSRTEGLKAASQKEVRTPDIQPEDKGSTVEVSDSALDAFEDENTSS